MPDLNGSAMGSVSSQTESTGTRGRHTRKRGQQDQYLMQEVAEQENEDEAIDHNNDNEADNNMDQKDEIVNKNKFNMANLNLKGNRNHEKK